MFDKVLWIVNWNWKRQYCVERSAEDKKTMLKWTTGAKKPIDLHQLSIEPFTGQVILFQKYNKKKLMWFAQRRNSERRKNWPISSDLMFDLVTEFIKQLNLRNNVNEKLKLNTSAKHQPNFWGIKIFETKKKQLNQIARNYLFVRFRFGRDIE